MRRLHIPLVRDSNLAPAAVAAAALIGGSVSVYADLESRVRGILLPDWGDAVMTVDGEPETVGPRWFCHSMANHWQINWYREPAYLARCSAVPPGGNIEVVMGTQRDESGREVVFQFDPAARAILQGPVPRYIEGVPIAETISGVALRRWRGTRIEADEETLIPSDEPIFALVLVSDAAVANEADYYVKSRAVGKEIVTFKPLGAKNGAVWSLIAPARLRPFVVTSLVTGAAVDSSDIHWFRMSSVPRSP
jgi:hypothetical protein